MTVQDRMLARLCPMFLRVDRDGKLLSAGPTISKVLAGEPRGHMLLDLFTVLRPRGVSSFSDLAGGPALRLSLQARRPPFPKFRAVMAPAGRGGAVLNLSLGLGETKLIHEFDLTARDFAATDLTIDLLYLIEANRVAMAAYRTLSRRQQTARHRAEAEASTDPLTGLANRRAAEACLERLLSTDVPFAVMQVDLDHFKAVNDTLGHAAGDHVLKTVGARMARELRADDLVARIGGDEFLLVLPKAVSVPVLAEVAARIIIAVERPVRFEGHPANVSASIGIALRNAAAATPADIIGRADEALYASKRAGRARFHFADANATGGSPTESSS